jgi:hypothetical protein
LRWQKVVKEEKGKGIGLYEKSKETRMKAGRTRARGGEEEEEEGRILI